MLYIQASSKKPCIAGKRIRKANVEADGST